MKKPKPACYYCLRHSACVCRRCLNPICIRHAAMARYPVLCIACIENDR